MDLSRWFSEQLQNSYDVFVWAMEELPEERRFLPPPNRPAEWSTARHAFHLLYYEREFALPSMCHWLGGPVRGTMVAGRWLMRDRVLLTLDEARIMARARELSAKLWKRM